MKLVLIVILSFIALACASVKYSHISAGPGGAAGYKAGKRFINGLGAFDNGNGRFADIARLAVSGGSVSDICAVGSNNGFLAVGDFTAVNGNPAYGIAYYNGTSWCSLPQLQLYTFIPGLNNGGTDVFPRQTAITSAAPGKASALYNIPGSNDFYVFGGSSSLYGFGSFPSFNQVGTVRDGVAGVVKLTYNGAGNFSVAGVGSNIRGINITNGVYSTANCDTSLACTSNQTAYAGITLPGYAATTTKFRVSIANSITNYYVQTGLGQAVMRWRSGTTANVDFQWTRIDRNSSYLLSIDTPGNQHFIQITNDLTFTVRDFELVDPANNVIVLAGNSQQQAVVGNIGFVTKTTTPGADVFSYTQVTSWPAVSGSVNFNTTNPANGAWRIAATDANTYYVAVTVYDTTGNPGSDAGPQYYVYKVVGGGAAPAPAGGRFYSANVNTHPITKMYSASTVTPNGVQTVAFAYGSSLLNYNQIYSAPNTAQRRYTTAIPTFVCFNGNDWVNAYGGGIVGFTNSPLVQATNNGATHYVFGNGATASYDVFSSAQVFGFDNTDHVKRWNGLVNSRLVTRDTTDVGTQGNVNAIHFVKNHRANVDDDVVLAGQFDTVGANSYGSILVLRTGNNALETLGGGLWALEDREYYTRDQITPIYRAGKVNDIEEIGDQYFVGGQFSKNINGDCLSNLAALNNKDGNAVWYSPAGGCNDEVYDLLAVGSKLYVGGVFTQCGNVVGTRSIASYQTSGDNSDRVFKALSTGFDEGSVVRAMVKFQGDLFVGGSFGSSPGSYRSGSTGLYRWDTKKWTPVISKCQKDCQSGALTPIAYSSTDPVSRGIDNVHSLRVIGGTCFALGSNQLYSYTGGYWNTLGDASVAASNGNTGTCFKQGCLASNVTQGGVIASGFTRSTGYNNFYQIYDSNLNNYVESYNGFDAAPVITASASFFSASLLLAMILSALAILF